MTTRMASNRPTRKVSAVAVAGALYAVAVLVVQQYTSLAPDPALVTALGTALSLVVGYVTPPAPEDGVITDPDDERLLNDAP